MSQATINTNRTNAGERQLTQRDRRADGAARHVRVTRNDILITRWFDGVRMMIAAPVEAYRGVGLVILANAPGDSLHRLILVHRDADLDVVLGDFVESAEANAAQAEWARWFNLARLAMRDQEWAIMAAPNGNRPVALRRRPGSIGRVRLSAPFRRQTGDTIRLAGEIDKSREVAARERTTLP